MRLARLTAPGGLENPRVSGEDRPSPKPGEILVRIRAASINLRDDFIVQGKVPFVDGRVPLSDGAGEMVEIGDRVSGLKLGTALLARFTHTGRPAK
ncbi:alcohol dehydrogenase catalytic domain-containing protein [Rhizobium sp. 1399]|uniref:alcohol dehydrogenase catalytic domain-containing protein n=1 Tax=Rhizobium sp. 1399 TaxID=2817758 RepID=UPI00286A149A|nr:alcohol dehydrogenase catalytic domain-containing protein [Rhizobium sp. 1399]